MLLSVSNLQIQFQTEDGLVQAVDGVSFDLEKGQTLGIVGESGCGKSVTALSLMRLLPMPPGRITAGSILFEGQDVLALEKSRLNELRGSMMGMIFQEPMTSLNPVYTVGSQIGEAIWIHRRDWNAQKVKARSIELLDWVGIPEPAKRLDSYPHELSGGMRQRAMIAMALSCEPKLLIADEPTTALDVTIQGQILELIKRLQKELDMGVILITHDLGVVAGMVDEVMVMYAGKAVEKAEVNSLFRNPMHPYTQGLLKSIPSSKNISYKLIDGKKVNRLNTIAGNVPSLKALPTGCNFQDRCPLVNASCKESDPVLTKKAESHLVSCFEVK